MSVNCVNCGRANLEYAKLCYYCGKYVVITQKEDQKSADNHGKDCNNGKNIFNGDKDTVEFLKSIFGIK